MLEQTPTALEGAPVASPGDAAVLKVAQLRKQYAETLAVDRLSFALLSGEVLGLVGPNGAGKTTTMRSIAGIIAPTAGSITVAGFDLQQDPIEAKRRLAYVPDDPRLFEALTVWEHLSFIAQVYRAGDWQPRAEQILQRLELLDRRDTIAQELSRGMRQKVAIACAMLHQPRLLMLDEPMTGLDPRGIRTMKAMLHEQAEQGAGVIVSSHLLPLVEDMCTHLLILHRGECHFVGSVQGARSAICGNEEGGTLEELFFRITEGAAETKGSTEAPSSAASEPGSA